MRPRLALLCVALVLAAVAAANPTSAFSRSALQPRAVGTTIVVDGNAYVSYGATNCGLVTHAFGGSCTVTFTNKAPKAIAFVATMTRDTSTAFSSATFGNTGAVNPGSTNTLTVSFNPCADCVSTQTDILVQATNAQHMDFAKTITFSVTWT